MDELIQKFNKVYIDEDSKGSALAERVRSLFPSDKIDYCNGNPRIKNFGKLSAQEFNQSKKLIYITPFKGSFFKRCPGARPGLTCCNYFVLNWGQQCDMNCSYCYLQSFINNPMLTLYSNIDDAFEELKLMGQTSKNYQIRVGTGEVVDSLSMDLLTDFARQSIEFFKDYPNWQLEFKTKSAQVDQFLNADHNNNVIVSWSINPDEIIQKEEHGTATMAERLNAAVKCKESGFKVSFHIDPMIWHPDWQKNYSNLIEQICHLFEPQDIPYLSVGGLRFQPEQRHMMRERFGMDSWVTTAEVFKSQDGKLRYDQRIRKEMFQHVINGFKSRSKNWNIFMCMETPETWLQTVGQMPKSDDGIKELFDHNVLRSYRELKRGLQKGESCTESVGL